MMGGNGDDDGFIEATPFTLGTSFSELFRSLNPFSTVSIASRLPIKIVQLSVRDNVISPTPHKSDTP